jgi:hypothetical protein
MSPDGTFRTWGQVRLESAKRTKADVLYSSSMNSPSSNRGWLSKIAGLHLDAVDVQVRHVDVPRLRALRRHGARIDPGTAVVEFVAAPVWQREAHVALADCGKFGGQIGQLVCDEMDDFALALDAALHGDHAGGEDDAAPALVERRPDHQVGDAGLVLDGDEHDALGGSRLLAHQHQTGGGQPFVVLETSIRDAVAKLDPQFGYADGFDEASGTYHGLIWAKDPPQPFSATAMLVGDAAAKKQLAEKIAAELPAPRGATAVPGASPGATVQTPSTPGPRKARRFYGSVELDMVRPVKAFDAVLNAIVMELQRTQGAKVKLTLELEAVAEDGFSDSDVSVVRDNARQLKFKPESTGFED